MTTTTYTCPNCSAPLAYDAQSEMLKCDSCGNVYDLDALAEVEHTTESEGIQFERPTETYGTEEVEQMQGFNCSACGAELLTENTTTATECPYCGSPNILPERIQGGVKPELVIPFTVTKEQAQQQFEEYFKGKTLMPNIFLDGRNRISEMRRLYVPYWLFDCDADATITYNAEKKRTERQGDYLVEYTRHYRVRRSGEMGFKNIPVDGSVKMDNKITESLEPYNLGEAVPFQAAVLSGALADCADVDAEACEARAAERVENSIATALRNTVTGYSSVSERSRRVHSENGKITPVLMPVWVITTEKEGKTYTFAINGQTGKLTCDVPADVGKSFLWGGGAFVGASALFMLILHFLKMMENGTIFMALLFALLIAFAVVGGLRSQLKQATSQYSASEYIREGSFKVRGRSDQFIHETVRRTKIETGNQKK